MILKDCISKDGIAVLIDTENSANIEFLNMLGLKPDKNLIYSQVDTIEDVFSIIEHVITEVRKTDKKKLVAIVWDSIAGTSTRKEMEEDVGDAQVALFARLIGQGLRKIKKLIGEQRICLVFLNQLRSKIGVSFGDPYCVDPFTTKIRVRYRVD